MMKPVFLERLLAVIAAIVILAFLSLPGAFCQDISAGEAGLHNQQGMEYFKKSFYDHAPKNQAADVERNYGLAVKSSRLHVREISPKQRPIGTLHAFITFRKTLTVPQRSIKELPSLPLPTSMRT